MRETRAQRDRGDAGFTVLELIAALVIMLGAAALVLPRVGTGLDRYRLRAATQELAAALSAVRNEAMTGSRDVVLVIDPRARRYWAEGAVKLRSLPAGVVVVAGPRAELAADDAPASVHFRPDGSASGGWIGLRSRRAAAAITVDWLTGAASIDWGR